LRHLLAAGLACLLGAATPGPAPAAGLADTRALREAVAIEGVAAHLEALEAIARANAGNRAAGTPGYDASADYVAGRLRAAGYEVTEQGFDFPVFEEVAPPVLEAGGVAPAEGSVRTLRGSASGAVRAPLVPVDLGLAPGAPPGTSTSGCEAEDFRGFPAGAVALLRRGTCPFQAKAANAAAAGAAAVVIFNSGQPGAEGPFSGRLSSPVPVPVLALDFPGGAALAEAAARAPAGGVAARVETRTRGGMVRTRNVIAELPTGDPARVVLVGAHLDSVPAGPGINDNGTGVAAALEIALRLAELRPPTPNRVRFAFWGAEELGLLGSRRYVDGLSREEAGRIRAVLNLDMLGSPNFGRFVYDGDGSEAGRPGPAGSGEIERILLDYFAAVGLPARSIDIAGGSDHAPFMARGVPAGGLYAGAGERKADSSAQMFGGRAGLLYDPCYHQACDTLANVSRRALEDLADAAAHGTMALALEPDTGP
jgi:Zn-dependent M28 family amino/carboxypeptidase